MSIARINNQPIDEYVSFEEHLLDRNEISSYIKQFSKIIVNKIDAEISLQPSLEILPIHVKDTEEILSIAVPFALPKFSTCFRGDPVS